MTLRNSSKIILFLTPHFRNSIFIPPHPLMFNIPCATYGLPPLSDTHSYVPSLYFVKGLNQNMILFNCNCTQHITNIFQSSPFSYQWNLDHLQQIIVFLFTTNFNHSSIFDPQTFSFNNYFPSDPHIFNRPVIWMPSLSTYLGSASWIIQFNLFQPSIWQCGNSALTHLVVCIYWGHICAKTIGAYFKLQYIFSNNLLRNDFLSFKLL